MAKAALKVVESPPFFVKDIQLWSEDSPQDSHSLHYALSLPNSTRPEIAAFFIDQYSSKGSVILDPFCGIGTTGLEGALRGRVVFLSDSDPLAVKVSRAKLNPADITEVTLELQLANLRRPVNLKHFQDYFEPFYDLETFRELLNLRQHCLSQGGRVSSFVQFVALSLLHGHSAGYFSVYSFPQLSLSPEEQLALNLKRNQMPDYRAIMPRILKKSATILRDGIPSVLHRLSRSNRVARADARDMSHLSSASVDLVVTAPPLPFRNVDLSKQCWLRYWFAGISDASSIEYFRENNLESWLDFMNESLLEIARVVVPNGRAVLELKPIENGRGEILLPDEPLLEHVESTLGRYWTAEGLWICEERRSQLPGFQSGRRADSANKQSRMLVLRRK